MIKKLDKMQNIHDTSKKDIKNFINLYGKWINIVNNNIKIDEESIKDDSKWEEV